MHVTGLPRQVPEVLQTSPVVQTSPSSHERPAAGTQRYVLPEHCGNKHWLPQTGGSPLHIATARWAVAHSRRAQTFAATRARRASWRVIVHHPCLGAVIAGAATSPLFSAWLPPRVPSRCAGRLDDMTLVFVKRPESWPRGWKSSPPMDCVPQAFASSHGVPTGATPQCHWTSSGPQVGAKHCWHSGTAPLYVAQLELGRHSSVNEAAARASRSLATAWRIIGRPPCGSCRQQPWRKLRVLIQPSSRGGARRGRCASVVSRRWSRRPARAPCSATRMNPPIQCVAPSITAPFAGCAEGTCSARAHEKHTGVRGEAASLLVLDFIP